MSTWAAQKVRECVVGVLSAIVLSGLTTCASSLQSRPLFFRLLGGPITGWIEAYHAHAFPSALQLLVPCTGLTVALAVAYIRRNSRFALGGAVGCWYLSGVMFSIGVGV